MANVFPWFGRNVLRPLMICTVGLRRDPLRAMFDRTTAALEERVRARKDKEEKGGAEKEMEKESEEKAVIFESNI